MPPTEAAGAQGKYWEMHDKLYEAQSQWSDLSDPTDTFAGYAQGLGLDKARFRLSLNNKEFSGFISQDESDGQKLGVNATPTFYINGIKFERILDLNQFEQEINSRLK